MAEFVGRQRPTRVLEVGCGTGHWVQVIAEMGATAVGLDPSSEMVRRDSRLNSEVLLCRGRAEALPFRNATFARVLCINALHHFEDPPTFFVEAVRTLGPAGRILVMGMDPSADVDEWFLYDYFDGVRARDRRRYPSTVQIRRWMTDAGFQQCQSKLAHRLVQSYDAEAVVKTLDKGFTSQLSLLSDEAYHRGLEKIAADARAAKSQGGLKLVVNVALFGIWGWITPPGPWGTLR